MPENTRVPTPRLHKRSGQSVVYLREPNGKRRTVYLGPHGSPEAARRFADLLPQLLTKQPVSTADAKAPRPDTWPTVGRLCADFLLHAQEYFRGPDGKRSREVATLIAASEPFLDVLRDRTTDSLTCADLAEVRRHFAAQRFRLERDEHGQPIPGTGKTRCRNYVNATMRRVRYILRWGTEAGKVPGNVWHSLTAFRNAGPGREGLRESEPVEAVPRALVDAVLPHLPPTLQAAVELMWWSGLRAGELCNLRMRDIERGEAVWTYRPYRHKGTWRGKDRVVRFGPTCIALLKPLLRADPDAYLFRPVDVMRERKEIWLRTRQSKETPSQVERRQRNAGKPERYGEQFDVNALRRAVHRACDEAEVPRWGLHRLRHAAGTRLVLEAGDDAARVQLGHADGRMVRRYSKAADETLGRQVASRFA